MRIMGLIVLSFIPLIAAAQEFHRAEVYGGYSYLNADFNNIVPRQSANGWETSVVGNVNRWIGIEGNVSGYYHNETVDLGVVGFPGATATLRVRDYAFAGGPKINLKPVFVHALFGADRLSGTASATGVGSEDLGNQWGFAMALGGGAQIPFSDHFAFRSSFDYLLSRHNIFGGNRVSQHNFRVGVGIVCLIGGGANRSRMRTGGSSDRELPIPQLGIIGEDTPDGFLITSVLPSSVLTNQGVTPNDLFISVDGKRITSAAQARALLPATGSVKLGFMFARSAYVERTVQIGQ